MAKTVVRDIGRTTYNTEEPFIFADIVSKNKRFFIISLGLIEIG